MTVSRLRSRSTAVRLLTAVSLLTAGAVALPASAGAPALSAEQVVVDQLLEPAQAWLDGPVVGLPPAEDVVLGRLQVLMDPAYWTNYVNEALVNGALILPSPIDVVRPEMYLPTVPVAAGKTASALPVVERDLSGVTYEWKGRTKTLSEFVTTTETDAVTFLHNGAVVDELYANGWNAETEHQPWSVTKSFVSALVGIAVDEKRVRSLQHPIEAYIPELAGTAWEGTTLQNLLEMESGVHWDEGTPVLAVNTQVQQWVQLALDLHTDGQLGQTRNEFLASLPRVAEQGTEFRYNSGNTQVLAWMLEKVYGRPFNEIISEKLWKPAGMAADAKVMTDRVGDAVASQGLYSRIHDLARFGELFRNDGRTPAGTRVVSKRWVRESTTMNAISQGQYAYQWWAGATPKGYEASGFEGQKITVAPESCVTGVRLAHQLGADTRPGDDTTPGFAVEMGGEEWTTVYRAVLEELGGCR
jgi:CubicO group peptidase (beta-lactamase class C family)